MRLENESAEQVCFGRISVNVAGKFRVVASVDKRGHYTTLGFRTVAPDKALSTDGEAHWVEIDRLTKDFFAKFNKRGGCELQSSVVPTSLTVDEGNEPFNSRIGRSRVQRGVVGQVCMAMSTTRWSSLREAPDAALTAIPRPTETT